MRIVHKLNFKLVLLPGANDFGIRVHDNIQRLLDTKKSFLLQVDTPRFNIGESKGKIPQGHSARNQKVFIFQDIANSDVSYKLRGQDHPYSPDDHFMDIIRAIGAIKGHDLETSVIMPVLYQSRQHKADNKESRDCAVALQTLENIGVKRIITCDIHNEGVFNATPFLETNSIWGTNPILETFLNKENINFNELYIISPDTGAIDRSSYWRDIFDCGSGYFDKVRDRKVISDGKNPIKKHVFVGQQEELKGKSAIIVDDMIDSGGSMIDSIKKAKELGAKNVYVISTFCFFSQGLEDFDKLYDENILSAVYSTNYTHIPEELMKRPWFQCADCSLEMAQYILHYADDESIAPLNKVDPDLVKKLEYKKRH